jgi:hypothetical protein
MKFKIIKYLFILLFMPLLLTSCCLFDYSDGIRPLLESLQELNRDYYNKHGKAAKNETVYVDMLKKMGCTNVVSVRKHGKSDSYNYDYDYGCIYSGKNYVVGFHVSGEKNIYVYISIHQSQCSFSIRSNGVHRSISCKNTGCYHPSH